MLRSLEGALAISGRDPGDWDILARSAHGSPPTSTTVMPTALARSIGLFMARLSPPCTGQSRAKLRRFLTFVSNDTGVWIAHSARQRMLLPPAGRIAVGRPRREVRQRIRQGRAAVAVIVALIVDADVPRPREQQPAYADGAAARQRAGRVVMGLPLVADAPIPYGRRGERRRKRWNTARMSRCDGSGNSTVPLRHEWPSRAYPLQSSRVATLQAPRESAFCRMVLTVGFDRARSSSGPSGRSSGGSRR